MNKICILGSTGLLGQAIVNTFKSFFPESILLTPTRADFDVLNKDALGLYLSQNQPDILINCVAYTDVDKPETDQEAKDMCLKLNFELVDNLVELTNKLGSKLIHFSTDYVFAGDKHDGYKEDHKPETPLNYYGETKKMAENSVLEKSENYYLIRTSWLFGPGKGNFVTAMLSLAEKLPELKIVNDQHGKPTYTIDIAERLAQMIKENVESGIYHLVNEGETTWYEFAKNIFTTFNKEVKVTTTTSEEFGRPAKRPAYSTLLCTKLPQLRNHMEALADYKKTLN